jgi:hypothetical protein
MAIAVVQAVAKNTLTSTISATGAGNGLIVCINSFGSSPSITSVKLGTANLTQASAKLISTTTFTESWIYYLANIAGGQTSVAVAGSNLSVDSTNGGIDIIEVSGLLTASMLDKSPAGGSGTSTAWSSGSSGTLSQANEIVIGTACGFNMVSPAGWTMVSGGGTGRRTGYKIVSATTAQTFNGTMSNADWTALITSFKGSSAAAVNPATSAIASML